jgi:hypothetical protein
VSLQNVGGRRKEVDPPHAEGESDASDPDEHGIQCPALSVNDCRKRRRRADDAFTQRMMANRLYRSAM